MEVTYIKSTPFSKIGNPQCAAVSMLSIHLIQYYHHYDISKTYHSLISSSRKGIQGINNNFRSINLNLQLLLWFKIRWCKVT